MDTTTASFNDLRIMVVHDKSEDTVGTVVLQNGLRLFEILNLRAALVMRATTLKNVTKLVIGFNESLTVSYEYLPVLCDMFPNLQEVDFSNCNVLYETHVFQFLENAKLFGVPITKVDISNCRALTIDTDILIKYLSTGPFTIQSFKMVGVRSQYNVPWSTFFLSLLEALVEAGNTTLFELGLSTNVLKKIERDVNTDLRLRDGLVVSLLSKTNIVRVGTLPNMSSWLKDTLVGNLNHRINTERKLRQILQAPNAPHLKVVVATLLCHQFCPRLPEEIWLMILNFLPLNLHEMN